MCPPGVHGSYIVVTSTGGSARLCAASCGDSGGRMSHPVRSVDPLRGSDPQRLGGHTLLGRLGAGGMGVVYLADGPSGRVAIKVVRDELSNDPGFRARFQREVRACFLVSGPWTARLVDFDVAANPPWLATE